MQFPSRNPHVSYLHNTVQDIMNTAEFTQGKKNKSFIQEISIRDNITNDNIMERQILLKLYNNKYLLLIQKEIPSLSIDSNPYRYKKDYKKIFINTRNPPYPGDILKLKELMENHFGKDIFMGNTSAKMIVTFTREGEIMFNNRSTEININRDFSKQNTNLLIKYADFILNGLIEIKKPLQSEIQKFNRADKFKDIFLPNDLNIKLYQNKNNIKNLQDILMNEIFSNRDPDIFQRGAPIDYEIFPFSLDDDDISDVSDISDSDDIP